MAQLQTAWRPTCSTRGDLGCRVAAELASPAEALTCNTHIRTCACEALSDSPCAQCSMLLRYWAVRVTRQSVCKPLALTATVAPTTVRASGPVMSRRCSTSRTLSRSCCSQRATFTSEISTCVRDQT